LFTRASSDATCGGFQSRCGGVVQTKLEKLGDEFGLLLPKELIEACGFGSEVTVTVQGHQLVVSAKPHPARQGWAEAMDAIPQEVIDRDWAELGDFREAPHEWDAADWHWPGTA